MKLRSHLVALLIAVAVAAAPLAATAAPTPATARITAWVSSKTPAPGSSVIAFAFLTIDGKGKPGQSVTFTFEFKSGNKTCTGKTDKRGIAWCRMNIGTAPLNTRVTVRAALKLDGKTHVAKTSFTPTRSAASGPAGATAAPAPTPAVAPTKWPRP